MNGDWDAPQRWLWYYPARVEFDRRQIDTTVGPAARQVALSDGA
jgi:hypothetical protein